MYNSIVLVGRIIDTEIRPAKYDPMSYSILCDIETINGDIHSNVDIFSDEAFYEKMKLGGYFVFHCRVTQFVETNNLGEVKVSNRMRVREVFEISSDDEKTKWLNSSNKFELEGELTEAPEIIDNNGDLVANIKLKASYRRYAYEVLSIKLENPKHIAYVEKLQEGSIVILAGTVAPDSTNSDDISIKVNFLIRKK